MCGLRETTDQRQRFVVNYTEALAGPAIFFLLLFSLLYILPGEGDFGADAWQRVGGRHFHTHAAMVAKRDISTNEMDFALHMHF